jgi:hypothetical protein
MPIEKSQDLEEEFLSPAVQKCFLKVEPENVSRQKTGLYTVLTAGDWVADFGTMKITGSGGEYTILFISF